MNKNLTISGRIGLFFACLLLLTASSQAQVSLRTAMDTDKDGKADLSIFRPEDGIWYILKSAGGVTFQPFGIANEDFPTPGDYDGDGKGDISVYRDTEGNWYRLNSADGTFNVIKFGLTGDEPIARDYDGDGKTDIAVVRRSNNQMIWYILGSRSGFTSSQFGLASDFTAPGDYDGDGKFDLAVQRGGPNPTDQAIFYILNSSNGGLQIAYWGMSKDIVVPGDYDGDGKTDVAVVREGATESDNLNWFILSSKTNNTGFISHTFGLTGSDYTIQNDYDGDGITDIAVWRDTNGIFYYLKSGDATVGIVKWGQRSDFPVAGHDSH